MAEHANSASAAKFQLAPLVYEGEIINARDEMLSLTDMWKAAKSDPSKRPVEWLRGENAQRFVNFMAEDLGMGEVGKSHFGLVVVKKGGKDGGSTLAHWQIALAYAKYLSPEFHMWCNTVVRERMEGRGVPAAIPADVLDLIRRTDGIARMLSHKVTEIERMLPALSTSPNISELVRQEVESRIAVDPRRAVLDFVSVRHLLDEAKALQKGRRSLNRKVGIGLRNRAAQNPGDVAAKCPNTGVWLFRRAFAKAYMAEIGERLVKEHNDAVMGLGVL